VRVLVACEFSGRVRDRFIRRGHDALSCDLEPSESPNGPHYIGDVWDLLGERWDLMIAFPPCTHLAVSGARHFARKQREQAEALDFVRLLMNAPIKRICIENPVSIISTRIRPPDQIIQPWQFGHREQKRTCLWLKNLPPLEPTSLCLTGIRRSVHNAPDTPERSRNRSRTFAGIAYAMATQWG
jgi:site-specific DNA-cytosine methylase